MSDHQHDDTTSLDPYAAGSPEPARGLAAGRHPLNITHLVMGIAFLSFTAIWAAVVADVVDGDDVRWLLPLPWVLAGTAGLLAIFFGGRRHGERP